MKDTKTLKELLKTLIEAVSSAARCEHEVGECESHATAVRNAEDAVVKHYEKPTTYAIRRVKSNKEIK